MSVEKGQPAPPVQLHNDEMQAFDLADYKGKQNVLLLFYPGAFTSVCTNELNMINNDLESYPDTQVVGISTDSPFVLAEFKKANGLTFPLLSDHNAEVSAAYGAKYDNDFTPMGLDRISKRSAIVVDKDGNIAHAEILENAGEMPDFDAVKSALGA
ncbi:MAG: redoxin domain-containing protein [Rhodothermales bacterium]